MYPSHRKTLSMASSSVHVGHSGMSRAQTKNGSQQTTKAPVMMASVLAAFFSRFASKVSRFFFWPLLSTAAAELAAEEAAPLEGGLLCIVLELLFLCSSVMSDWWWWWSLLAASVISMLNATVACMAEASPALWSGPMAAAADAADE